MREIKLYNISHNFEKAALWLKCDSQRFEDQNTIQIFSYHQKKNSITKLAIFTFDNKKKAAIIVSKDAVLGAQKNMTLFCKNFHDKILQI